jgi:hypothetical protein
LKCKGRIGEVTHACRALGYYRRHGTEDAHALLNAWSIPALDVDIHDAFATLGVVVGNDTQQTRPQAH